MERLAARILEHQHGPSAVVRELQRLHRPLPIQLILQGVFVSQTIEARARRVLGGRQNDQHSAPVAVIADAQPSADDALAVFPQNLRATIRIAVQRIQHLSDSAFKSSAVKPGRTILSTLFSRKTTSFCSRQASPSTLRRPSRAPVCLAPNDLPGETPC